MRVHLALVQAGFACWHLYPAQAVYSYGFGRSALMGIAPATVKLLQGQSVLRGHATMAKAKVARRGGTPSRRSSRSARSPDAISLLKADHRQVEKWFQEFQSARSTQRKATLANAICRALTLHTLLEEELFYPAFLQATGDTDIHHEAEIEHDNAKKMIAQIEASKPEDEYYDSMVHVLSEMIKHHVKEEEKRGGMFAKAKQSKMDLLSLGRQLAERKSQLAAHGAAKPQPSAAVTSAASLARH